MSTACVDLLGEKAPGIEREISEQKCREQRKDHQIGERQLEGGGAEKLSERAHILTRQRILSRIMYPAPRTVCSSGWAKPLSIFERSREMCTSITLVCGSK